LNVTKSSSLSGLKTPYALMALTASPSSAHASSNRIGMLFTINWSLSSRTLSGATPRCFASAAVNCTLKSRPAIIAAFPEKYVVRDAEVGPESSVLVESPLTTRMRPMLTPAASPTIWARVVSEPGPISGVPVFATTIPSGVTSMRAVDGLRTPLYPIPYPKDATPSPRLTCAGACSVASARRRSS
jgi:hypothetical protein